MFSVIEWEFLLEKSTWKRAGWIELLSFRCSSQSFNGVFHDLVTEGTTGLVRMKFKICDPKSLTYLKCPFKFWKEAVPQTPEPFWGLNRNNWWPGGGIITLVVAVEEQGLNVTCVFNFLGNTPMMLRMAYVFKLSGYVHHWWGGSERTRRRSHRRRAENRSGGVALPDCRCGWHELRVALGFDRSLTKLIPAYFRMKILESESEYPKSKLAGK